MFSIRVYVENVITGECRSIFKKVTKQTYEKVMNEIIKTLGENERVFKPEF